VTKTDAPASVGGGAGIALALGGGGARGLAHIVVLEALDELGVSVTAIAGTSIGGMVGAAYASGMPAVEIREHVLRVLGDRVSAARHLLRDGVQGLRGILDFNPFKAPMIDGVRLLETVMPGGLADDFSSTKIPLALIATDFYGRDEAVLKSGPLAPAIAASMALPGLFLPQSISGRLLIDGGISNPLPVDHIQGAGALTVGVDVVGRRQPRDDQRATSFELVFGSIQIMQKAMVTAKLRDCPVDILIEPDVGAYKVLDFFKATDILARNAPLKDDVKRRIETAITAAG